MEVRGAKRAISLSFVLNNFNPCRSRAPQPCKKPSELSFTSNQASSPCGTSTLPCAGRVLRGPYQPGKEKGGQSVSSPTDSSGKRRVRAGKAKEAKARLLSCWRADSRATVGASTMACLGGSVGFIGGWESRG